MARSFRRLLVVCTLASSLSLLGMVTLAQHARGALRERALSIAPQLAGFAELIDRETRVELNGHLLHLSTMTSERDVNALLARFGELCMVHAPRLTRAQLDAPAGRADGASASWVLREDLGPQGGLATCFAPAGAARPPTLPERVAAHGRSLDASELYQLRFMLARPTPGGGSHVLFAWSEGPLHAETMFPEHGDAAGADFATLPRPSGGTRMLSAQVHDAAYGVVVHRVSATPEVALTRYLTQLAQSGFRTLPAALAPPGLHAAIAGIVRGDQSAVVHAFEHRGQTVVAVTQLGTHRLERAHATIAREEPHGK